MTTKIHLECDGKCRPLSLVLSEGQRADSNFLEVVLDAVRVPRAGRGRPRKRGGKVYLDKGYSHSKCRRALRRRGVRHLIPERDDQIAGRKKNGRNGGRPVVFDKVAYA